MMRALLVVAAIVLTLFAAACGGERGASAPQAVPAGGVEFPRPAAPPSVMPTPAPVWKEVTVERVASEEGEKAGYGLGAPGATSDLDDQVAERAALDRIIVRTVDIELKVEAVPQAMRDVSKLAAEFGGWVVSTEQTQKHRGFISIRVPAGRLDEALSQLRAMAAEVDSERTT
ncbi:MAG: DUF4349 domain-containing protein, partial [Gemmatimonadetes bacterium]|nr:DUF4349 domain-containing protein [Gemmatimonadota bacterium]